jgi:outer membrane receptor protein involved in Fe transport
MWKKGWLLVGLLLLALVYPVGKMFGQAVYGSIIGTVTDSTGAVVPRAKVTITEVDKNVSFSTATNESGNYEQTHLIVGTYRVRIEAPGFQAYVQENVSVNVDAAVRVDAKLQLGALTQTVEVTGAVPLLKTERTDVATTFSTKAVEELPIFNRNFTQFELLTPGTQRLGWQHAASENPQGSIQIMVNGQHFGGTSFQLDGTDNRDPILGIIVINPNLDSVTEAKITTQNYDAEFGQATAGVVTAQTKSGTNELHGTAFLFRRNDLTQARNPFTQSVPIEGSNNRFIPQSLWDQFGGSLGGPIKKNKTFLFGDYQGTRRKMGGSALTRVPTAAERTGDLSDLGVDIFNPCNGALTDCNVDPALRQQFMGDDGKSPNVIPTARLSPQALALLKYIPLPNIPGATGETPNHSSSGSQIFNDDAFNLRADHYWSEKLHLFGRYSYARFRRAGPGAYGLITGGPAFDVDPTVGGFSGQSDVRNQSIASGFDYTLRPTWLTDFRFGFFRYRVFVNPNGLGTSPATDAGIPGLNLDNTFTSGMPAFYINGRGSFNFGYALGVNQCNCPLDQQEQQWQFVNNWTNIRGNHTLKFGADIRYAQNLRVPSDSHRSGELNFNSERTEGAAGGGLGLASFLLGDLSSFDRYISKVTDAAERQKRWFFYGQDTWRMTPKLSLSYGLRWELYFPQTVNGKDKGGWVDVGTGETLIAGEKGVGMNGNVSNTFTHLAPRLGIAYQVTPKTVVRMGYGRSFDIGVFGVTFGHTVTQNLPVLATQSLRPSDSWRSVFALNQGPAALDPDVILQNNCNPITDPTGTKTECLGPNGRPLYPDGVMPRVLPRQNLMPTVDAWNATIQHQLTPSLALEAAYVGNKGTRMYVGDGEWYDANTPTIVGFGTLSLDQRKPFYSRYGWTQPIGWYGKDGNNRYNSLQAKVEKRFSQGYSIVAHYTLATARNFDGNYWAVDHSVAFGPPDWQRKNVFVFSHIWELPFGKGKKFLGNAPRALDLLVGGWQLSGVTTWASGLPFTPSYLDCGSDVDTGPCRPDLIGDASVSNPSQHGWFETAGAELATNGAVGGPWKRPAAGTFGNAKRNSLRGPGLFLGDMAFFKNFQITERLKGQFRGESFNIWNRANLDNPDGCVDCESGGHIFGLVSGTAMRQWQFAVRFQF